MSGSLLTNLQIERLINKRTIEIRPFEKERCQLAHYPIDPETIWIREQSKWVYAHSFRDNQEPYVISPNGYVLVEIRQHIALADGYVGTFLPASNLIEMGLSITAGKISFPFGQKNERIRFGLKNNLEDSVAIGPAHLVAYIQIFDISKSERTPYQLNDRDNRLYEIRHARANDDGVNYDDPYCPV